MVIGKVLLTVKFSQERNQKSSRYEQLFHSSNKLMAF